MVRRCEAFRVGAQANWLSPSSAPGSLILTVMGSLLLQLKVRLSGSSPEPAAGVKPMGSSCGWIVRGALPGSPRATARGAGPSPAGGAGPSPAGGAGPSTAAWAKEPPGPWTDSWTDCRSGGVSVLPVQFRLAVST